MTLQEFENAVLNFILSSEAPDLLPQLKSIVVKERKISGLGLFTDFQAPEELVGNIDDNRMLGVMKFAVESRFMDGRIIELSGDLVRFVLLVDHGKISQLEMFQDGLNKKFPVEFSNLHLSSF